MKKYLSLVLVIILSVAIFPFAASAAKIGDTIGYAQPTDIVATINGFQIESYNVDGYTYICVEDLRYYGFDVYYNPSARTLSFSRNYSNYINPQASNPNFWNIGSSNVRRNILYTDIVTYANGSYVPASNINGQTIINFNALSRFGAVSYDNNRREISLVIDGVNYNPAVEVASIIEEAAGKNLGGWTARVRAKGNMIVLKFTSTTVYSKSTADNSSSFINSVQHGETYNDLKKTLDDLRSFGYDISSIYAEYYTGKGEKVTSVQIY